MTPEKLMAQMADTIESLQQQSDKQRQALEQLKERNKKLNNENIGKQLQKESLLDEIEQKDKALEMAREALENTLQYYDNWRTHDAIDFIDSINSNEALGGNTNE